MANSDIKKVGENNNKPLYHCLPESELTHPWLLITHGKKLQRHTFYSISKDEYFIKLIPEMRHKQVTQASYGWLFLMDDDTLDCCLMNPKTMEKIQLPKVVDDYGQYRCILSKPPTEPDCHVLLLGCTILFCRVGDDKFIERPIKIGGGFLFAATNFKGTIYAWMSEKRGFVTLDFVNGDLVLNNLVNKDGQQCRIPCNRLSPSDAPKFDDFLLESDDDLLLVHTICSSTHVYQVAGYRIFKIDMVKMECEELKSISDRAIFLSNFGSMVMSSSSKVKKDCIYYTNPFLDDRNLYVYSIEDGLQTLILPCPIVCGWYSLKSWIMI